MVSSPLTLPFEPSARVSMPRLRLGLWLGIAATLCLVVGDVATAGDDLWALLSLKALLVVALGLTSWRLARPADGKQAAAPILIAMAALFLVTAVSGILTQDHITTPLLGALVAMASASLLTWGIWSQIKAIALVSLAIVGNALGVEGSDSPASFYLLFVVAFGLASSLWIAFLLDRQQRALADENRRRRDAEAQLSAAREQVAVASRVKTDFLATLSHEVRTPLNGVIGMAGLLTDTSLDAEQREYVGLLCTSAESLLETLNAMVDLSSIEHGDVALENVSFDLPQVVDDVEKQLLPRARAKGLTFSCLVYGNVPRALQGDSRRLAQVLIKLLDNAIKFTERGTVTLRAKVLQEDRDRVRLRFEVSDTGIGIPADRLGGVFEVFSQVDPSSTRQHGGIGISLAICKRLITLLGGEIELHSVLGRGSTFWVTVPMQKAPPSAASVEAA